MPLSDCCFSLARLKTRHTQRHIHPGTDTKTHTCIQTDTGIQRDTDPQIQTRRYPHTYTQRDTDTRHTDIYTLQRDRQSVTQANRHTCTHARASTRTQSRGTIVTMPESNIFSVPLSRIARLHHFSSFLSFSIFSSTDFLSHFKDVQARPN